jgi:hypothetical protein
VFPITTGAPRDEFHPYIVTMDSWRPCPKISCSSEYAFTLHRLDTDHVDIYRAARLEVGGASRTCAVSPCRTIRASELPWITAVHSRVERKRRRVL